MALQRIAHSNAFTKRAAQRAAQAETSHLVSGEEAHPIDCNISTLRCSRIRKQLQYIRSVWEVTNGKVTY
eukprot:667177-Amphidinium_carterae.2